MNNNYNNQNEVTIENYQEKITQLNNLISQINRFVVSLQDEQSNPLPQGLPATVNGTAGIMQILHCGRSKANDIMNNPKYQSAFCGGKGTRNRLCDTKKLLALMSEE